MAKRSPHSLIALALGVVAITIHAAVPQRTIEDEYRRAQVHAAIPDTMHASTPDDWHQRSMHPLPASPKPTDSTDHIRLKSSKSSAETAQSVFRQRISDPVVQTKCVRCHVRGGVSGHTRLRFVATSTIGHITTNYQQFVGFLDVEQNGAEAILDKIVGLRSHGGGVQVPPDTTLYGHMRGFLSLLDAERAGRGGDLFAGVTLKSPPQGALPGGHHVRWQTADAGRVRIGGERR